jgi:hypothetical protein
MAGIVGTSRSAVQDLCASVLSIALSKGVIQKMVERVLSLRHTCRIRGRPTFPILVEAVSCLFKGKRPDLSWIAQHESLPVSSTL